VTLSPVGKKLFSDTLFVSPAMFFDARTETTAGEMNMPNWLAIMQSVVTAMQTLVSEIDTISKDVGNGGKPTPAQIAKLAAYTKTHQSVAAGAAILSEHHSQEQ
jgi:hypothetical protein